MTREGFVFTEPSERDRRSINVVLKDKGRDSLGKAMPVATELIKQIMSPFTEADALRLSKMLGALRDNAYSRLNDITR
jgi:DNA-binding MarR family transcriptional regulator